MKRDFQFVVLLFTILGSVPILGASDSQITVGAAVGSSTQAAGDDNSPYLGPGFGGTSLGSVIFVTTRVTSAIDLGGEVSLASDITGSQFERASQGGNALLSHHHDTIVSGVVKMNTHDWSNRLQVAALAGLGLGIRQTNRVGTFTPSTPPFLMTPVNESLTDAVLAVTGGLDWVIALRRRMGILALVRVHYLADDDRRPDGVVQRGVSSVIWRFGLGAQVRF